MCSCPASTPASFVENFQKTVLSHIDSDETGSWPIQLNELGTSETNCNRWSLISLWEGLYVCASGSGGLELMIKKDLPVVCSYFSGTWLNTGPFLQIPLVRLFVCFQLPLFEWNSTEETKRPASQNIYWCKIQTQMRKEIKTGEPNWLVFRYLTGVLMKQHAYGIAATGRRTTHMCVTEFS